MTRPIRHKRAPATRCLREAIRRAESRSTLPRILVCKRFRGLWYLPNLRNRVTVTPNSATPPPETCESECPAWMLRNSVNSLRRVPRRTHQTILPHPCRFRQARRRCIPPRFLRFCPTASKFLVSSSMPRLPIPPHCTPNYRGQTSLIAILTNCRFIRMLTSSRMAVRFDLILAVTGPVPRPPIVLVIADKYLRAGSPIALLSLPIPPTAAHRHTPFQMQFSTLPHYHPFKIS